MLHSSETAETKRKQDEGKECVASHYWICEMMVDCSEGAPQVASRPEETAHPPHLQAIVQASGTRVIGRHPVID